MPRSASSVNKRYKNRPASKVIVNLQIDREAARLLRQYAESPRGHGRFVSELLYAYQRREAFKEFLDQEGRSELQRLCQQVRQDSQRSIGP